MSNGGGVSLLHYRLCLDMDGVYYIQGNELSLSLSHLFSKLSWAFDKTLIGCSFVLINFEENHVVMGSLINWLSCMNATLSVTPHDSLVFWYFLIEDALV